MLDLIAKCNFLQLHYFSCCIIINPRLKQVTVDSARQSQIEAGLPAVVARKNILEYEGFRARIDMAKPQQVDCHLFESRVNKILDKKYLFYRMRSLQGVLPMDLQTISILKSVTFIFFLVLPSYIIVPKMLHTWDQWKKTNKPIYLSHTLFFCAVAALSYIAALIIVIMRFLGLS